MRLTAFPLGTAIPGISWILGLDPIKETPDCSCGVTLSPASRSLQVAICHILCLSEGWKLEGDLVVLSLVSSRYNYLSSWVPHWYTKKSDGEKQYVCVCDLPSALD